MLFPVVAVRLGSPDFHIYHTVRKFPPLTRKLIPFSTAGSIDVEASFYFVALRRKLNSADRTFRFLCRQTRRMKRQQRIDFAPSSSFTSPTFVLWNSLSWPVKTYPRASSREK